MVENPGPSIAFFDFDGTITSKDTLAEIIKFAKGKLAYYSGLIILSPVLIAFKLRLLSNQKAKEIMLRFFFGGTPLSDFNSMCQEFVRIKLPAILRRQAINEIRKHIQEHTKVVIVSASPANWITPWCEQFNIECIATSLVVKDKKITGKISGNNCSGKEKVRLISAKYNLSAFSKIYAYGDTRGDLPMLALSTHKFYKPFKERF